MTRLAFPFAAAPNGRSMSLAYASDDQVKQMLELLIMTIASERVMRPDFGSPVRQMLFSAGNGPVAIALEATLQATINQWLGHVLDLHDLAVEFSENDAVIDIAVTYATRATKLAGTVKLRKELT